MCRGRSGAPLRSLALLPRGLQACSSPNWRPSSLSKGAQLDHFKAWLVFIRLQVPEWVPQTQSDPVLIEAADLLQLIIAFKDSAMLAYQADIQHLSHTQRDSSRRLHAATLMCYMFGWLPPLKSSMLISLQIPHQPHACLQDNCSCAGNYLHT